jgi:hypothetical protein
VGAAHDAAVPTLEGQAHLMGVTVTLIVRRALRTNAEIICITTARDEKYEQRKPLHQDPL